MNIFSGIIGFDRKPISQESLKKAFFSTPYWGPDQQSILCEDSLGFLSTQRFVTPQCAQFKMPFKHVESGCIIVANAFLTNHTEVCKKLNLSCETSDAALILKAYLKWDVDCLLHLQGQFCFFIWNTKNKNGFAATDPLGVYPFLFSYKKNEQFIFANEVSSIKKLSSSLTLNPNLFAYFSLDFLPEEETAFKEIQRILPGHYLLVTDQKIIQNIYWDLKNIPKKNHVSRAECYEAFQEKFTEAVKNSLRTVYPVTTHLSGGLDSSALTSVAAFLKNDQKIYAVTAIPRALSGNSYRPNWRHHEMPLVQKILERYPHVKHFSYTAKEPYDFFERFNFLRDLIDQPIRNVANFDWLIGAAEYACHRDSRVLLHAQTGNATISWHGMMLYQNLKNFYVALKNFLLPTHWFKVFSSCINKSFFYSSAAKKILRERFVYLDKQYALIRGLRPSARASSVLAVYFWYGITPVDPTQDLEIVKFCYSLPQEMFCKGRKILEKRLLVREALAKFLPLEICQNTYRGEQGADWYLHYNEHHKKWFETINHFPHTHFLWDYYDRENVLAIPKRFPAPILSVDSNIFNDINCHYLRCLSAIHFINSFSS